MCLYHTEALSPPPAIPTLGQINQVPISNKIFVSELSREDLSDFLGIEMSLRIIWKSNCDLGRGVSVPGALTGQQ